MCRDPMQSTSAVVLNALSRANQTQRASSPPCAMHHFFKPAAQSFRFRTARSLNWFREAGQPIDAAGDILLHHQWKHLLFTAVHNAASRNMKAVPVCVQDVLRDVAARRAARGMQPLLAAILGAELDTHLFCVLLPYALLAPVGVPEDPHDGLHSRFMQVCMLCSAMPTEAAAAYWRLLAGPAEQWQGARQWQASLHAAMAAAEQALHGRGALPRTVVLPALPGDLAQPASPAQQADYAAGLAAACAAPGCGLDLSQGLGPMRVPLLITLQRSLHAFMSDPRISRMPALQAWLQGVEVKLQVPAAPQAHAPHAPAPAPAPGQAAATAPTPQQPAHAMHAPMPPPPPSPPPTSASAAAGQSTREVQRKLLAGAGLVLGGVTEGGEGEAAPPIRCVVALAALGGNGVIHASIAKLHEHSSIPATKQPFGSSVSTSRLHGQGRGRYLCMALCLACACSAVRVCKAHAGHTAAIWRDGEAAA